MLPSQDVLLKITSLQTHCHLGTYPNALNFQSNGGFGLLGNHKISKGNSDLQHNVAQNLDKTKQANCKCDFLQWIDRLFSGGNNQESKFWPIKTGWSLDKISR